MIVGDTTARQVYHDQPVKFAAMEVVTESGSDQPEVFFGRYDSDDNTVSGGISIPGLNSILAGFSRDTEVQGLDSVDRGDRPSNVTLVHWAFDIMVGIGTLLLGLVAWFAIAYWRRRDIPKSRLFLWAAASAGVLTYIAIECGWIVTEVGRQPWIVYNTERTTDAVTTSGNIWVSFTVIAVVYVAIGIGTIRVLRAMSRRWHRQEADDASVPYGPPAALDSELAAVGEDSP
jgi:cytochrome d ubiquinol oxidase subunit I